MESIKIWVKLGRKMTKIDVSEAQYFGMFDNILISYDLKQLFRMNINHEFKCYILLCRDDLTHSAVFVLKELGYVYF